MNRLIEIFYLLLAFAIGLVLYTDISIFSESSFKLLHGVLLFYLGYRALFTWRENEVWKVKKEAYKILLDYKVSLGSSMEDFAGLLIKVNILHHYFEHASDKKNENQLKEPKDILELFYKELDEYYSKYTTTINSVTEFQISRLRTALASIDVTWSKSFTDNFYSKIHHYLSMEDEAPPKMALDIIIHEFKTKERLKKHSPHEIVILCLSTIDDINEATSKVIEGTNKLKEYIEVALKEIEQKEVITS